MEAHIGIKSKGIIVIYDGNIGSGKTTIIKLLAQKFVHMKQFIIYESFVDEHWEMFKNYYNDEKKYAFDLNKTILEDQREKIKQIFELQEKTLVFIDRSADSHLHVFSKIQMEKGNISKEQYSELESIYKGNYYSDFLDVESEMNKLKEEFHVINFYIKTRLEECIENIKERHQNENREGEEKIDRDRLELIEKLGLESFSDRISIFNIELDEGRKQNLLISSELIKFLWEY